MSGEDVPKTFKVPSVNSRSNKGKEIEGSTINQVSDKDVKNT